MRGKKKLRQRKRIRKHRVVSEKRIVLKSIGTFRLPMIKEGSENQSQKGREAQVMEKKVLVGLRSDDRIDDVVSFLRGILTPGVKVVFLVPYPVKAWSYLPPHCDDAEIGRAATLAGRKHLGQFIWEAQRNLAEAKVSSAREALRDKNVKVEFELYTGRLMSAICDCANRSAFEWIVTLKRDAFGSTIRKAIATLFGSLPADIRAMYIYRCRWAQ